MGDTRQEISKRIKLSEIEGKSIFYIRAIATMLILLCHLVQMSSIEIILLSSQFFNIGVQLFFIISGFLYGRRQISDKSKYSRWMFERTVKIVIPMYLLMLIILCADIIKPYESVSKNFIFYIFNLQGIGKYVLGAEHLWYLTVIMFCYLITPILEKVRYKFNSKKNCFIFLSVFLLIQIVCYCFGLTKTVTYMTMILIYILSYCIGSFCLLSKAKVKDLFIYFALTIVGIAVRIICRYFLYGTAIYNTFCVSYSSLFIGFGIFLSIFCLIKMKNRYEIPKIVKWFSGISYYVYLVHYMFIVGPLYLYLTENTFLNAGIIFVVSIVSGMVLKLVSEKIIKLILNK